MHVGNLAPVLHAPLHHLWLNDAQRHRSLPHRTSITDICLTFNLDIYTKLVENYKIVREAMTDNQCGMYSPRREFIVTASC